MHYHLRELRVPTNSANSTYGYIGTYEYVCTFKYFYIDKTSAVKCQQFGHKSAHSCIFGQKEVHILVPSKYLSCCGPKLKKFRKNFSFTFLTFATFGIIGTKYAYTQRQISRQFSVSEYCLSYSNQASLVVYLAREKNVL